MLRYNAIGEMPRHWATEAFELASALAAHEETIDFSGMLQKKVMAWREPGQNDRQRATW